MKIPKIIITLLAALASISCTRNDGKFDASPASLSTYLGTQLPPSIHVLNLAAYDKDGIVLLQVKFEISQPEFEDLANRLGLEKGTGAIVSTAFKLKDAFSGDWWNPPAVEEQMEMSNRYTTPQALSSSGYNIKMIWVSGTAYLSKLGTHAPPAIVKEPK